MLGFVSAAAAGRFRNLLSVTVGFGPLPLSYIFVGSCNVLWDRQEVLGQSYDIIIRNMVII